MRQDPDVAVALDGMSLDESVHLVERLGDECTWVKVGLELFTRAGPDAVRTFKDRNKLVFLDLKLHDIPNTVAGAVRSVAHLGADLVTVHAAGGTEMVQFARDAADDSGDDLGIVAVTILTSLDAWALASIWGIQPPVQLAEQVKRLAQAAVGAGAHGIVSSVHEAQILRATLPGDTLLVTPGIRLAGDSADDQARVASPGQAVGAGADLLVVGRSITQAADPVVAIRRVRDELTAGSHSK